MGCLGVPCYCLFHCPTVPVCQGPGHFILPSVHIGMFFMNCSLCQLLPIILMQLHRPTATDRLYSHFCPTLYCQISRTKPPTDTHVHRKSSLIVFTPLYAWPHWGTGNCPGGWELPLNSCILYVAVKGLTRCDGQCLCNSQSPITPSSSPPHVPAQDDFSARTM